MGGLLLVGCSIFGFAAATASAAWTGPVEVSGVGVMAASPQVAVDAADNTTVVWGSGGSPNRTVRSAFRPAGGPWEASFTRIPALQDCFAPELAVNPAGAAVVVADCGTGTASMYAAYRPAGGSWSGAVAIPGSGSGDRPSVGLDDAGNAIAVWGSGMTVQSAYRPAAGPWVGGGQVSPAGNVAVDPQVAMSPTGGAVAIWRHRLERMAGDPVVTVESTTRVGAGAWAASPTVLTRPAPTSTIPVSLEEPQVRVNRAAQRFAVWTNDPSAGPNTLASGWGSGGDFGTWGGYFSIGSASDGVRNVEVPQVAFDDQGSSVAVWRGYDVGTFTFRTQAAATSALNGAWSSPVTLANIETGLSEPQVAVDPAGDATILWRNLDATMSAVSRPAGGAFGAATSITSTAFGTPDLTMNATGDTIATWTSSSSSPVRAVVDVNDVTAPVLSAIDVPSSAGVGSAVNASATALDVWSAPVALSWDFGDGTTVAGASVSHAYADAGTRAITVTATDAVGNVTTQTRQIDITGGGGGDGDGDGGALTLGVTVPKQSWKKIRKGGGIKLRCSLDAAGGCEAKATVTSKVARRLGLKAGKGARAALTLGSGSGTIAKAGATTTFLVKLTRKARGAIGRATKSVPLKLTVTGSAPGRTSATLSRKFKIKR
ncbi:MAG: PKD domain-containing protein [Solirubrobacterales bacterium]